MRNDCLDTWKFFCVRQDLNINSFSYCIPIFQNDHLTLENFHMTWWKASRGMNSSRSRRFHVIDRRVQLPSCAPTLGHLCWFFTQVGDSEVSALIVKRKWMDSIFMPQICSYFISICSSNNAQTWLLAILKHTWECLETRMLPNHRAFQWHSCFMGHP